MSGQLESRHYFKSSDTVRHFDGRSGEVVESYALYAVIAWSEGGQEEFDQFDSAVEVTLRGHSE